MWNYAQLSQAAKIAGGPERYVEALIAGGKALGRMQMVPWLAVAGIGGSLLTYGGVKFAEHIKAKKEAEIAVAKEQVIEGIKEYDAEHEVEEESADEEPV